MEKCMIGVAAVTMALANPGHAQTYREPYRDQYHFSPAQNWMNDPNGLLYHDGVFNMYFQYNPLGNVPANQSWGHAVGPDLLHWRDLPVAIPFQQNAAGQDSLLIFSGSAVADGHNTSGFGLPGHPPLVAIYAGDYPITQTLPNGQFILDGQQTINLAYSLDKGVTWKQYAGNPVVPLPPSPYQDQYQNFRDPKVFWYAPGNKWVMVAVLSALHEAILFSSPDLKSWTPMSTFGPANAIGGVWECPDLFELPVDGDGTRKKWVLMLGINPGGYSGGSGTQYFVGDFDGTKFTADPDSVHNHRPPRGSKVVQKFEAPSFAAMGWTATGGLAGYGPVYGAIGGQQMVTGFLGRQFVDTFLSGDATVGTVTSPEFQITEPYINLLVGGGYHPYNPRTAGTPADIETGVNLRIDGKVVASATGADSEHLDWKSWNVTAYQGRMARVEIVDNFTGGWGHVNVDEIVQSDVPKEAANWVDYGPDFYAAASWNGLPDDQRIVVGWMNNWDYGPLVPTSPWRSAMSIPRKFSLRTIDGRIRLVQHPVVDLPSIWGADVDSSTSPFTILPGVWNTPTPIGGKSVDISADFKPGTARDFGLQVHRGKGFETAIGYDAVIQEVYIDRFNSGDTGFEPSFAGRYAAPLKPSVSGHVKLRVLVDASSIEVFAGEGEAVLTAQVFPPPSANGISVFAKGGYATLASIEVHRVHSIWGR